MAYPGRPVSAQRATYFPPENRPRSPFRPQSPALLSHSRVTALIRHTQPQISDALRSANERAQLVARGVRRQEEEEKSGNPRRSSLASAALDSGVKDFLSILTKDKPKGPTAVRQAPVVHDFEATLAELGQAVTDAKSGVRRTGAGGKSGQDIQTLPVGVGMTGTIEVSTYKHFKFFVDEPVEVLVVLRAVAGDPDLYISTSTKMPTKEDFTWSAGKKGTDSITIKPDDPAFVVGHYYVGVYGSAGAQVKQGTRYITDPNVAYYLSVSKKLQATAERKLTASERIIRKQGYGDDPESMARLTTAVKTTMWNRNNARRQIADTDFVAANIEGAKSAKMVSGGRAAKHAARIAEERAREIPVPDDAARQMAMAVGSGGAGFDGGTLQSYMFASGVDARDSSGRPRRASTSNRRGSAEALFSAKEHWAVARRGVASLIAPKQSKATKAQEVEHERKKAEVAAERAMKAHARGFDKDPPQYPSFTLWQLPTEPRQTAEQALMALDQADGAEAVEPATPGEIAIKMRTGGEFAFGTSTHRGDDAIGAPLSPTRELRLRPLPRRNTPPSLTSLLPRNLTRPAKQRPATSSGDAAGGGATGGGQQLRRSASHSGAMMGASGTIDGTGGGIPGLGRTTGGDLAASAATLPSPPRRGYLNPYRANRRVPKEWRADDPALAGDLSETLASTAGQSRNVKDAMAPPEGVVVVSQRPNASLGTVFGVHPVLSLNATGAHVRLPPLDIGGEDLTVEMWVYVVNVTAKNARFIEFGHEEYDRRRTPAELQRAKDAGAPTIAGRVFDWLVDGAAGGGGDLDSEQGSELSELEFGGAAAVDEDDKAGGDDDYDAGPEGSTRKKGAPGGGDGGCYLGLHMQTGKPCWAVRHKGRWRYVVSRTKLQIDTWTHLCVVAAARGRVELYMNGDLVGTGTVPMPSKLPRRRVFVGASTWDTDARDLVGKLFALRLWSSARTYAQVRATIAADLDCEDDNLGLRMQLEKGVLRDLAHAVSAEDAKVKARRGNSATAAAVDGDGGAGAVMSATAQGFGTAAMASTDGGVGGPGSVLLAGTAKRKKKAAVAKRMIRGVAMPQLLQEDDFEDPRQQMLSVSQRSAANREQDRELGLVPGGDSRDDGYGDEYGDENGGGGADGYATGGGGTGTARGAAAASSGDLRLKKPVLSDPRLASLGGVLSLWGKKEDDSPGLPLSLDPALVASYPFTEGVGALAADALAVHPSAVLMSGASWTLNNAPAPGTRARSVLLAARFDALVRQFDREGALLRLDAKETFIEISKRYASGALGQGGGRLARMALSDLGVDLAKLDAEAMSPSGRRSPFASHRSPSVGGRSPDGRRGTTGSGSVAGDDDNRSVTSTASRSTAASGVGWRKLKLRSREAAFKAFKMFVGGQQDTNFSLDPKEKGWAFVRVKDIFDWATNPAAATSGSVPRGPASSLAAGARPQSRRQSLSRGAALPEDVRRARVLVPWSEPHIDSVPAVGGAVTYFVVQPPADKRLQLCVNVKYGGLKVPNHRGSERGDRRRGGQAAAAAAAAAADAEAMGQTLTFLVGRGVRAPTPPNHVWAVRAGDEGLGRTRRGGGTAGAKKSKGKTGRGKGKGRKGAGAGGSGAGGGDGDGKGKGKGAGEVAVTAAAATGGAAKSAGGGQGAAAAFSGANKAEVFPRSGFVMLTGPDSFLENARAYIIAVYPSDVLAARALDLAQRAEKRTSSDAQGGSSRKAAASASGGGGSGPGGGAVGGGGGVDGANGGGRPPSPVRTGTASSVKGRGLASADAALTSALGASTRSNLGASLASDAGASASELPQVHFSISVTAKLAPTAAALTARRFTGTEVDVPVGKDAFLSHAGGEHGDGDAGDRRGGGGSASGAGGGTLGGGTDKGRYGRKPRLRSEVPLGRGVGAGLALGPGGAQASLADDNVLMIDDGFEWSGPTLEQLHTDRFLLSLRHSQHQREYGAAKSAVFSAVEQTEVSFGPKKRARGGVMAPTASRGR